MRFSAGHDYYDTSLGFGRDETLFFERKPHEKADVIPHKGSSFTRSAAVTFAFKGEKSWQQYPGYTKGGRTYTYCPFTVFFAGERFAGVRLGVTAKGLAVEIAPQLEEHFFWSKDMFKDHLVQQGEELRRYDRPRYGVIDGNLVDEYFERRSQQSEIDWMIEKRISIAVSTNVRGWSYSERNGGWTINCDGLDKIGFQKCLNPFDAFQKLSQWVGGVLAGEGRPMAKITDEKVILAKHGFDKQSFKHRV